MIVISPPDVLIPAGECGLHTFMYRGEGLHDLEKRFGRTGIAGKIHHKPMRDDEGISDYLWGMHYMKDIERTPLLEALAIQNICALHGLSPRVYGLAIWRDRYGMRRPVQVTDDLGKSDWYLDASAIEDIYTRICALGDTIGFTVPGRDAGGQNIVASKWVDFNGFHFLPDYPDRLMVRYWAGTRWGDRPYQQPLDGDRTVDTCRNIDDRIADLGLDTLDFDPRTICDIGCSGGQFLNYLTRHYAARGLGLDSQWAIPAAAEYSAYTGAWNIDYQVADLNTLDAVPGGPYDLVLFLSMSRHVGLPEYVKQVAGKRLIVELHDEHKDKIKDWLYNEFKIIREHVSRDYGRLVIHAERKSA